MSELQSKLLIHSTMWPTIIIPFGLSLTAAWIRLLGYGVFRLIEFAISNSQARQQISKLK